MALRAFSQEEMSLKEISVPLQSWAIGTSTTQSGRIDAKEGRGKLWQLEEKQL